MSGLKKMREDRQRAVALMGRQVTAHWTEMGDSLRVGPGYQPVSVPCTVTVCGEVSGWAVTTDDEATVTIAGYGRVRLNDVLEAAPRGPWWRKVAFYLGLTEGI